MDGKRNGMQTLTLALCVLLLGLNFWQSGQIADLRDRLDNAQNLMMDGMDHLQSRVASLEARIEEGEKLVREWELTPAGLDQASGSLLTEVSLTLKEWRADTEVWLTAHQGSGTQIVTLENAGTGNFSGPLPVSLAGEALRLEVRVSNDGTSRQEELGGWMDLAMLLPLRISSSGYSGPEYQNGIFFLDDYVLYLVGRGGEPAAAEEPVFFLQRNGVTVWEAEAAAPEENGYSTGGTAEAECQTGDTMALFFACRDAEGLRYTFPLESWEIIEGGEDSDIRHMAPAVSPILSWD